MTLPESVYRDLLVAQLGGKAEVALAFGRADAMIPLYLVVEVEPFTRWREGVRQALAYAAMTGVDAGYATFPKMQPCIAIYGSMRAEDARKVWDRVWRFTSVLFLRGTEWARITSGREAERSFMVGSDADILAALESRLAYLARIRAA